MITGSSHSVVTVVFQGLDYLHSCGKNRHPTNEHWNSVLAFIYPWLKPQWLSLHKIMAQITMVSEKIFHISLFVNLSAI